MSFRVTARTLIHLGAELISSDAVALFELVKNAFDAQSDQVTIQVVIRIEHQEVQYLLNCIDIEQNTNEISREHNLETLRKRATNAIDLAAPEANELILSLGRVKCLSDLRNTLEGANYIAIRDTGEGMSLETLNDVFLTIGTRSRLTTRSHRNHNGSSRPVLGEKGVGRLSTMRLGTRLHVESSTAGEPKWNVLDIDWSVFSHESDELLDSYHIEAKHGDMKDQAGISGTSLTISGLTSNWDKKTLEDLARREFMKLTDPFADLTLFPVQLHFNGERVRIPPFNQLLLSNAHAHVRASLVRVTKGMRLAGKTEYKSREKAFSLEAEHLISASESSAAVLENLGPFELDLYWYNRRILSALEGVGDRREVLRLVREWGGGIMVFRDGFRVLPYGGPDDDWLNLDRRAFGSGGYKVNRAQIIGCLRISGFDNPALTDQTNREGLRDCEEKRALVNLLMHIVQNELRTFLNAIDAEDKAREPISLEDLDRRVQEEERKIRDNVSQLIDRVPELRRERSLLNEVNTAVEQLRGLMAEVQEIADSYETGRGQLLNLAGIGLSVEILAHELNRATEHVLRTLSDASGNNRTSPMGSTLRMLEAQLKTLQRRLRVLDPLSTSGRQRRERFDVVALARDTIEDHSERFNREGINCSLEIEPASGPRDLRIRAVKGMVVQILGNLVDNSVYWLRQTKTLNPDHESKIVIAINTEEQRLSVTDNGPGVARDLRERVFEAFFTTKPAGQGKGLGLFIGREIARYHGADLYIEEPLKEDDDACHTFVLTLGGMEA